MFANRRRKERLANTLCILNKLLETKKFIIHDQFTLADICVATQLLPVFGKDENKPLSQLQVQISYLSPFNCRSLKRLGCQRVSLEASLEKFEGTLTNYHS